MARKLPKENEIKPISSSVPETSAREECQYLGLGLGIVKGEKFKRLLSTFVNPLAWVAIMVTASFSGPSLLIGWYCFIASCSTASCRVLVPRGYSRRCWHGIVCSKTLKYDEDIVSLRGEQSARSREKKMELEQVGCVGEQ